MKYTLTLITAALFLSACASKSAKVNSSQEQANQQKKVEAEQKQVQDKAAEAQTAEKTEAVAVKEERIKIKSDQEDIKDDQPLAVIARYTKKLRGYVDQPNSKDREKGIAQEVREFFNFQELAKRSLGRHWTSQSSRNRKQFSDLFIQLVESSYLKRSRQIIGDYEVTFKNQKIKGNDAKVTSTVSQEDANIDITYDLQQKNNQWMIYNITLDDVNLVRTYQSQFNKIIKDKGFSHLIGLMKKRVASQEEVDVSL